MIDERLNSLKELIVNQGLLAEKMVGQSIKGLLERDESALNQVVEEFETDMNEYEIKVDDACAKFIALYQPEGLVLRTALMVYKIGSDLERIGDLAVNISEEAKKLITMPAIKPFVDLPRMAEEAVWMLRSSIESLLKNDIQLAKEVCLRDDVVDRLKYKIIEELEEKVKERPDSFNWILGTIFVAKNLERIADHATNICEDVIYMCEGRVVKHHKEDI